MTTVASRASGTIVAICGIGQDHGNNKVAGSKLQLAEQEGDLQVGGSDQQGYPSLVVPTHMSNTIETMQVNPVQIHNQTGKTGVLKGTLSCRAIHLRDN